MPKVQLCDRCRLDGGWHWSETDPDAPPTRCPNILAAAQHKEALALTAEAHVEAFRAAKAIVKDFAETHPEFSSNHTREAMTIAGVPGPVVGAAFRAQAEAGVIEATGIYDKNTDDNTRHRITRWRSLIHESYIANHTSRTNQRVS